MLTAEQWQKVAELFADEAKDVTALTDSFYVKNARIAELHAQKDNLRNEVARLKRENRKLRKAIKESAK